MLPLVLNLSVLQLRLRNIEMLMHIVLHGNYRAKWRTARNVLLPLHDLCVPLMCGIAKYVYCGLLRMSFGRKQRGVNSPALHLSDNLVPGSMYETS